MGTHDELSHAQRMMEGLLKTLYLEDAIRWMHRVAQLGSNPVIVRDYAPNGRNIISIKVERNTPLKTLQDKYARMLAQRRSGLSV